MSYHWGVCLLVLLLPPDLRRRVSSKEAESKAVFRSLEQQGLKAALAAVKEVVRCKHVEQEVAAGRLTKLGPILAVRPRMYSELVGYMGRKEEGVNATDLLPR